MLRIILFSEKTQKHRLIAAHIIRQTADRFQNNFLQHHVADVVDFARSASGIVVGTAIKFLIRFQAFRRTEMKFCAAVRAIRQACKQALPAGFGRSVYAFLNGDKYHAKRRIHDLKQPSYFNLLSVQVAVHKSDSGGAARCISCGIFLSMCRRKRRKPLPRY